MSKPVIGYAGMTHLGINSAAAAAARGFPTIWFDPDEERIAALRQGNLPVVEPGLDDLMKDASQNIAFHSDLAALGKCDVVYIASDVPTDDHGQSDLAGIRSLIDTVCSGMRKDATLVILCQVPPGFTRALSWPASQRIYQVETLIFGRAVERAMYPERFIIGADDPARPLPTQLAAFLAAFDCPVLPMLYESAELAKIAINCCLVASVTIANTLAELCERIGADWHEIVPALKLDKRIGQYSYLSPGLGIAGGNLERDLATVLQFSGDTGSEAGLIRSFIANSRHRRDWALRTLHDEVLSRIPAPTIGVLGLAYKENTHSIKNSPSIGLLDHLHAWNVRLHDPVVPAEAAHHPRSAACGSPVEAATGADVLVIMTPWPEFRNIPPSEIARVMKGRLVIDPYQVLAKEAAAQAGLRIITLGRKS